MIHVLLTLLKIIGIVILVLLGLIIAIVFMVLLVPVRYNISADVNEDTKVSLRISWLLGLVRVRAEYLNRVLNYNVRIAFYPIADSRRSQKKKKKKSEKKASDTGNSSDNTIHENPDINNDGTNAENRDNAENHAVSKTASENVPEITNAKERPDSFQTKTEGKKKNKKHFSFPDINGIITVVTGRADNILKMINDQENRDFVIFILENLQKIFSHVRPKRHDIYLYFGADDPSVTGQAYGAYCVINSILGLNFRFEPEFNKKILKLTAVISGRIRVLNLLTTGAKVYFNKTFRKLIGGSV